jgi:hypothetical protein
MDTSGDNDFSLLFASREDKDAVKRRCLELIENELKKLPKSDKPDLQSLDKKLDDENSMDVHSKVDTTVDMNAGSQETSELMKAEIENALYEKIFLFTLENEEAHVTRYPVRGQKAPPCMIYLPEMADNEKSEGLACWFNTDNIDGVFKQCKCKPQGSTACTCDCWSAGYHRETSNASSREEYCVDTEIFG